MEIPFHRPHITDSDIDAVSNCLRNGWLTMGKKTIEFETRFSRYTGSAHAVAVNSCTAALHLALKCCGCGPGDEVIIPAVTFAATAEVVTYFGARPVMADIEKDTHLIDVSSIEKNITGKTRAIIPVHYSGQPADMDSIMDLARSRGLTVIEDAAHALPARYRSRMIGSIGDITCFSFYATKPLTTGEGGMATTENPDWAEQMRVLRLHGISSHAWQRYSVRGAWQYDVTDAGYKYNTTDISSSLGLEQLIKADRLNSLRANIAERYNSAFSSRNEFLPYSVLADRETSWHIYPLRLNIDALDIDRDDFIVELSKRKIGTSVHFIPLYRFSYYHELGYSAEEYPWSEWVFARTLSLPIYPGMTDAEVDFVINNVIDIAEGHRR